MTAFINVFLVSGKEDDTVPKRTRHRKRRGIFDSVGRRMREPGVYSTKNES